jgi:hypothetical protein
MACQAQAHTTLAVIQLRIPIGMIFSFFDGERLLEALCQPDA